MEKKFEFGLVLGRFNHIHNGHIEIIEMARSLCKKTLILIGSARRKWNHKEPFQIGSEERGYSKNL